MVAQVYTLDGDPEIILAHIEVEGRRRKTFPARMFEYYMLFRLRFRLPVYPIVIYLSSGAGGFTAERHEERLFDQQINLFTYQAVGLPDLLADEYQEHENPLGAALSALMKPSQFGRVVQKYRSLRAMARANVDDARKAILSNVIENYLPLSSAERDELQILLATPEGKEITKMISVYEQKGIDMGIDMGIEQGKRDWLLRLLRGKFDVVPDDIVKSIEAIHDVAQLDRLFDQAMRISSLEDLKLPGA